MGVQMSLESLLCFSYVYVRPLLLVGASMGACVYVFTSFVNEGGVSYHGVKSLSVHCVSLGICHIHTHTHTHTSL